MAKEQEAGAEGEAVEETLPQWQPPASATRSVTITPNIALEATRSVTIAPNVALEAAARSGALAPNIGLEHTLQAGPISVAPPRELAIGDIIVDRYVIEQHISSGGFGAVYRASDRQIRHHQVALKLLHLPAADEAARQSALRELTLIASVSHPSVVQFKDYGWFEGRLWFAMPWYRGETLDARFRDSAGPLPISRPIARTIFERLARGLAAMHEVGIHHHDIKPENIFVADIAGFDGGLPVLLDLGIASARGEGPKGLTVEYAAPEVAAAALGNREREIGAAADVFSLALVLRNLLEPETAPPNEGELLPMLHKRATERVEPPSGRDLRYLKPVFERWLSLDPDERPTVAEFATELAVLTEPEERREARKRLLRRIAPIVAVAAIAVTLLVLVVRQQKTQITVQRKQLTAQQQQSEQLKQQSAEFRQQSADQLAKLEDTSNKELRSAIGIARELSSKLGDSEERADGLTRKVRKLTDERTALTTERDALTRDRDRLQQRGDAFERERDRLLTERDDLRREREGLQGELAALRRERDRIEADRNTAIAQRNDMIQKRDRLQADLDGVERRLAKSDAEVDGLRKSFDAARTELKDLRQKVRDLEADSKRLEAQNRSLETQLRAARQRTPTIGPAPADSTRTRLRTP